MRRWISLGLILASANAGAGAMIKNTRFTSCTTPNACVEVKSKKAFQDSLGTNSIFFSSPTIDITDRTGRKQSWLAESVYFDALANRLFIRSLKNDPSGHNEAYYNLSTGELVFIGKF